MQSDLDMRLKAILATAATVVSIAALAEEAQAESSPPSNTVTAELGLLPGLTQLGLEYAHPYGHYFDLAGSMSLGLVLDALSLQAAIVPHLRATAGSWTFKVGAGPGVAVYSYGDTDVYPQLQAELSIEYRTKGNFVFHFRGGAYAFCDGNAGSLDCSDIDKGPFGGFGIGKAY